MRPARFGVGVLLQTSDFVSVEYEVYLSQPLLGSAPNRVALFAKFDELGVLSEGLPPDLDKGFVKLRFHRTAGIICSWE